MRGLSDGPSLQRLGVDECWRLLESRSFGRLCCFVDDRVLVGLAPYAVHAGGVYFRAAAYGELARLVRTRTVTLEVDDVSGTPLTGWAVTVTGSTHHVDDASTLAALWSPVRPLPWGSGLEPLWIALTADDVEGRRLQPDSH